jgi:hypothetical protein
MEIPFTTEAFLQVFVRYNEGIWPLQIAFYAVAALLIALAARPSRHSARWISGLLALLWAWMGVVYQWGYFASINPAADVFGALFVLQALAIVLAGVYRDRLSFRTKPDRYGVIGAVLVAYALIIYPILSGVAGHGYPRGATFGLPCPTTIFTFGLLLWADRQVPPWVIVIPAAWSFVGFSAALQLAIPEDYGLLVAGVVATILILSRNRRLRDRAGFSPRSTRRARRARHEETSVRRRLPMT